jgi:hypothetical protein
VGEKIFTAPSQGGEEYEEETEDVTLSCAPLGDEGPTVYKR